MVARKVDGAAELKALAGQHVGYSSYVEVTQERVQKFAEASGDHQWIHVDVERANRESPFGGPIAHGYLTLSLGPMLYSEVLEVSGFSMGVNYGANKIRYPAPVPVGARIRLGVDVLSVDDIDGGVAVTNRFTYEAEGSDKPSCVADVIYRQYV
jgi:acyl dehydratase